MQSVLHGWATDYLQKFPDRFGRPDTISASWTRRKDFAYLFVAHVSPISLCKREPSLAHPAVEVFRINRIVITAPREITPVLNDPPCMTSNRLIVLAKLASHLISSTVDSRNKVDEKTRVAVKRLKQSSWFPLIFKKSKERELVSHSQLKFDILSFQVVKKTSNFVCKRRRLSTRWIGNYRLVEYCGHKRWRTERFPLSP